MKRKLKIVMLAPFGLKTKGTVAARVLPIAETLAARGHQVRVIVPPWDDPADSPDLSLKRPRQETRNGVEIRFIPVRPGPQPLTIPLRMVKEAVLYRADVIHVFKPKAFSGLAALLLSLLKRPFVLDTDDWEGTGGYNDVSPYTPMQKRLFAWQERDLPRRATAITVASRTLQTQAWGFGIKPERVLYLPNGISPHKYADWNDPALPQAAQEWRSKYNLSSEHFVLLAYTRFVEFKPERLLQIFKLVLEKLPPERAEQTRLLIVGAGFYGEEKVFLKLAEQYGVASRLIMTGTVAVSDLPAILRGGDIALYPFDDNLINRSRSSAKFLDLLMAERPVVTEAVGELREYLRDGQGGFIVPPGDNHAFAEAVIKLVGFSQAERETFGKAGARRLKENFTWNRLGGLLEEMYYKLS